MFSLFIFISHLARVAVATNGGCRDRADGGRLVVDLDSWLGLRIAMKIITCVSEKSGSMR